MKSPDPGRSPVVARALPWVALSFVALLTVETALRASFRWDMLVWSESPFMTDMLKLTAGQPLFGPAADVNSFVYSPGLAVITHAILSPLGLALDVRACRVVTILLGVAAAACLGWAALYVVRGGPVEPRARRHARMLVGCLSALVVFRNFTSDVPHPDNLHLAHLAVTLLLGCAALDRRSFPLALACVLFAGLGVLAKQVGSVTFVGVAAALVWRGRWGRTRAIALAAAATASAGVSLGFLLADARSRFYLFNLLSRHPLGPWPGKLEQLGIDLASHPLLLMLPVLALLGARSLWRIGDDRARDVVALWTGLAVTGALPSLVAYVKFMGQWNNFSAVTAWCVVTALPGFLLPELGLAAPSEDAARDEAVPARAPGLVLAALLLVWAFPLKLSPGDEAIDAGRKLDGAIAEDVRAGRRILLAHGTMPLIRAGVRDAPLDRANSFLELATGGKGQQAGTRERIEAGYYDVIYINSPWFGPDLYADMLESYEPSDRIVPAGRFDIRGGNQGLMAFGVEILRKKPPAQPSAPRRRPRAR